jgi:hypothetical protein
VAYRISVAQAGEGGACSSPRERNKKRSRTNGTEQISPQARRPAGRNLVKKLLVVGLSILLLGGCTTSTTLQKPPDAQNPPQKVVHERTVVVVQKPSEGGHEDSSVHGSNVQVSDTSDLEQEANQAVANYYNAAEDGDFTYTYNNLTSYGQTYYTYDQWVTLNTNSGTASSTFNVDYVTIESPAKSQLEKTDAKVDLTIYAPDGNTYTRTTYFVQEGGAWKHVLTEEERAIFNQYLSSTAKYKQINSEGSKLMGQGGAHETDSHPDPQPRAT